MNPKYHPGECVLVLKYTSEEFKKNTSACVLQCFNIEQNKEIFYLVGNEGGSHSYQFESNLISDDVDYHAGENFDTHAKNEEE